MTSRFSSKNKAKKAQKENSVNKKKQKESTRKQITALQAVEPGLSARASNYLTTAPQ